MKLRKSHWQTIGGLADNEIIALETVKPRLVEPRAGFSALARRLYIRNGRWQGRLDLSICKSILKEQMHEYDISTVR